MSSSLAGASHSRTQHDFGEVLEGTVSLALIIVLQVASSDEELSRLRSDQSLLPFLRMTRFQLERNMVEAITVLKGVSFGTGLFAMTSLAARRGTLWALWSQKWSQQNVTHELAMTIFQVSCILQQIPWPGLRSSRRFDESLQPQQVATDGSMPAVAIGTSQPAEGSDIDARAQGNEVNPTLSVAAGLCLVLYSIELGLIFSWQGSVALMDWIFLLDVGVILCGFTEIVMDSFIPERELAARIGILRLLRLARVIRLLQLLRKTRALRELQKLVTMMSTCLKALAWSFIFCFVIMTIWAMLMVEIIFPLIKEMHLRDPAIFEECPQCLRATSSVMDANLLLFKTVIAGDSWGTIAVPVIEAYPATAVIFVGSLLTLVFGVLNLIVAVVVDTFADARDRDILNLAEEMEQDMEADKRFLEGVFNRIDVDKTGQLTLDQLVEGARTDTEFQSRLKVMDIDEMDLVQLFEMIDVDASGAIEQNEFIRPLSRWVRDSKTAPRFIKYNMMRVMHKQDELQAEQVELQRCFQNHFAEINQRIDQLQSDLTGFGTPHRCIPRRPQPPRTEPPVAKEMPWPSMDADFVVEIVEQPRSSERVTLKRLSESQADVEDAMKRLESLVLQATESALKESTGMVKHLLMDLRPEIPEVLPMQIPAPQLVELPGRVQPHPVPQVQPPEISKGEGNHLDGDTDLAATAPTACEDT
eukprot:s292_g14.t1